MEPSRRLTHWVGRLTVHGTYLDGGIQRRHDLYRRIVRHIRLDELTPMRHAPDPLGRATWTGVFMWFVTVTKEPDASLDGTTGPQGPKKRPHERVDQTGGFLYWYKMKGQKPNLYFLFSKISQKRIHERICSKHSLIPVYHISSWDKFASQMIIMVNDSDMVYRQTVPVTTIVIHERLVFHFKLLIRM